jgi:hypothetical protein
VWLRKLVISKEVELQPEVEVEVECLYVFICATSFCSPTKSSCLCKSNVNLSVQLWGRSNSCPLPEKQTRVSFSWPIVHRKFALRTAPASAESSGFSPEDLTSLYVNVQLWCG